jgi:hypothetical protein
MADSAMALAIVSSVAGLGFKLCRCSAKRFSSHKLIDRMMQPCLTAVSTITLFGKLHTQTHAVGLSSSPTHVGAEICDICNLSFIHFPSHVKAQTKSFVGVVCKRGKGYAFRQKQSSITPAADLGIQLLPRCMNLQGFWFYVSIDFYCDLQHKQALFGW